MTGFQSEVRLKDRTARARLEPRLEPYWWSFFPTAHIGYYRGAKRGSWVVRLRVNGSYRKKCIGRTDDREDANGKTVLNWKQALDVAINWFKNQPMGAAGELPTAAELLPPEPVLNPQTGTPIPSADLTVLDAITACSPSAPMAQI